MEFDQVIFKKVVDFYDKWKHRKNNDLSDRMVSLEGLISRLTIISRALTGRNIDILPAEEEGGWKGVTFYLPASFSLLPTLEQNIKFYIFRTVYLCIQSTRDMNWSEYNGYTLQQSRIQSQNAASSIIEIMKMEYPSIEQFYQSVLVQFQEDGQKNYWLYGKFMYDKDVIENGKNNSQDKDAYRKDTVKPSTEIKSKPVEEVEILTVDKKAQDEWVLTHNFEKVETAEEFSGVWRGFDGDDTLEEDEDALNELNLRHLVRTDEVAQSIYQGQFRDLVSLAESSDVQTGPSYLTYDEWDYHRRKYKTDYCKVYLSAVEGGDADYATRCLKENRKTLNDLRRKFAMIHQKRQKVNKLPHGESLDIDALIDWHTDLKSGRTPSENIYYSLRKKESDLAILFLLDISLSTDSYADGNRVLDVEKQAIILFGEVLTEFNVDFSVCGFYSKTRNNCGFTTIKDFGEFWQKGKQKLGSVNPQGYTRIGPALRHANTCIQKHDAKNKWVILLSDGKPNDYDRYEGKYGLADVKQSLREMHERHIQTYAIAIESVARYYLPQMFGQNHYNILSHPDMLVPSLARLYRRISNT